jgi:hypothetical protein
VGNSGVVVGCIPPILQCPYIGHVHVPKAEVDELAIDFDLSAVILEHGGHVLLGELISSVGNKHACLTDTAVTYYH